MQSSDIIAIASCVVAAASAVFTGITVHTQKAHNIRSVKPLLSVAFIKSAEVIELKLCNNGLGPAIIRTIDFHEGEEVISFPSIDLIALACFPSFHAKSRPHSSAQTTFM